MKVLREFRRNLNFYLTQVRKFKFRKLCIVIVLYVLYLKGRNFCGRNFRKIKFREIWFFSLWEKRVKMG